VTRPRLLHGSKAPSSTAATRRRFLAGVPLLAAAAACRGGGAAPPPFRVALTLGIGSLDPHASTTTAAFTVLGNLFEPLVFNFRQGLRPGLSNRWSSPDPFTWIFELRPGVRFHSGRTLRAQDVVYSYRRAQGRSDLEVGYYLGDVESVEAASETTVRVRTRRRAPALLSRLAHVFVVPEGTNPGDSAEGSGPYRLAEWDRAARRLRLKRFDGHWGSRPALSQVEVHLGIPPLEAERGLETGAYDLAQFGGARPQRDGAEAWAIRRRSTLYVKYLGFDLARETTPFVPEIPNPFRDRRVREAIHLAIDRPRMLSRLPTNGVPAYQLVPRDVFGYASDLPPDRPDPTRSRALLKAAGLADGFRATLHTRPILAETAELVKEELAGVGIRLDLAIRPDEELFAAIGRHELSLWLDRWSCSTGESAELFETALHTRDESRGLGLYNESGYSNPTLDAAIESALETERPVERRSALQQLMRTAMHDLPWVPLYSDEDLWGLRRGWVWEPNVDFWLHLRDIRPA